MKYDFKVGDYFITNNNEEGYILKEYSRKSH